MNRLRLHRLRRVGVSSRVFPSLNNSTNDSSDSKLAAPLPNPLFSIPATLSQFELRWLVGSLNLFWISSVLSESLGLCCGFRSYSLESGMVDHRVKQLTLACL